MLTQFPLLEEIAELLKNLPGVGKKSAQRYTLWLAENIGITRKLADSLSKLSSTLDICPKCHGLMERGLEICPICSDETRRKDTLCVVEGLENFFAIESSGVYNGLYYILGKLTSPVNGIERALSSLDSLLERVKKEGVKELILVVSSTVEGDLTAQYIKEKLKGSNTVVSRIAYGIPVGADVSYLDKSTLVEAFKSRRTV